MNEFKTPPGVYLQLYRGAMRGKRPELIRHLDACKKLHEEGVIAGVLPHGFPRDWERNAQSIADECRARALPFGLAWGLDGSKDDDKTRLTAKEKGAAIGDVCVAVKPLFGALNNESQWDSDTGPDDDMDEQGALDMGAEIRKRDPDVVLCNQPWPAILQHGDIRKRPLLIDRGGPFEGFPIDEMATYCQWFADQRYWENWKRRDRYRFLNAWAEREWAAVDAALDAAGLKRPRTLTIQGYHHDEQPWTVVDAVLANRDKPLIVWCEPFPDGTTLRCLQAAQALVARGFVRNGENHREGIKRYQAERNIVMDGWCGRETIQHILT